MKTTKYLSIMAAALALGACSNDDIIPAGGVDDNGEGKPIAFTSAITSSLDVLEEENLDGNAVKGTRSSLNNGEFAAWTVGDKISVSDGTLMYSYKVSKVDDKKCTFDVVDGKTAFTGTNAANKTFYAAYPAAAVKSWNGSTVTEQIYAEQNYAENVNDGAMGAYMVTSADADETGTKVSFSFAHTASVIEVNLGTLGVTPKAVYLKSNSGVAIAGELTCDASNKNITVKTTGGTAYATSSQSDVIGLTNVASDATIARFYILPVKLVGGVTVTVVDTDGNYYTKKTSTDIGSTEDAVSVTNNIGKEPDQIAVPTTTGVKPYYKKVNFGAATGDNGAKRTGNWMATIPSNIHWNLLSTPGAHDACTAGQSFGASAECQDLTLQELLDAGVRCFDLRPGYYHTETISATNLYIWHGQTKTGTKYVDAIKMLADFLAANPTEAISVVMTKENNKPTLDVFNSYTDRSSEMWSVLNACHTENAAYMKVLNHSYYNLADFRGKICYFNRTGTDCTNTVRITNWPDDDTVSNWGCETGGGTCKANVQDKYNSNDGKGTEKQDAVKEMLRISSDNTDVHNFTFNYTSSANSPSSYASKTNPAITSYLSGDNISGSTGYLLCDYIGCTKNGGDELLKAIVNQNYKYVYKNRTRNTAAPTPGSGIGTEVAGDEYADEGIVYSNKR